MSLHSQFAPSPIPLIQVTHLPSASSFYAALTQPLNIRYLSATTTYPATLTFGHPNAPLFALTQSPYPAPQLQSIYLPASTPKQVADFYSKSRLLNPNCRETGILNAEVEGGRKAITRDLDGNILEAVYSPRPMTAPTPMMEGPVTTEKEARRVLQWQHEVAKSTSGAENGGEGGENGSTVSQNKAGPRRADTFPLPMRLVRRETVTEHYTTAPPPSEQAQNATGISGKAIIGTILGAAAGAAVAYAMTRSEVVPPSPAASQSYPPPQFPTQSQFQPPPYPHSNFQKPNLGRSATYSHPPPIEVLPARSHASIRERAEPRHIRYAIQPAPTPPPTGLVRSFTDDGGVGVKMLENAHGSVNGGGSRVSVRSKVSTRSRSEYPPDASARSRASFNHVPRDENDGKSNVSSRSQSKSKSGRSRSHVSRREVIEVEVEEPDDRQSNISRSSRRSRRDRDDRDREREERDEDSFTTARSHASSSTAKPPRRKHSTSSRVSVTIVGRDGERVVHSTQPEPQPHRERERERDRERDPHQPRSHVSSRSHQTTREAREVPLPHSVVSARDIPLPASIAGSHRFGGGGASYVGRGVRGRDEDSEDDDEGGFYGGGAKGRNGAGYAGSVAPSDSVSCAGGKRERERLRGRMGY